MKTLETIAAVLLYAIPATLCFAVFQTAESKSWALFFDVLILFLFCMLLIWGQKAKNTGGEK